MKESNIKEKYKNFICRLNNSVRRFFFQNVKNVI